MKTRAKCIVIAAPKSSSGKTTVSIALMQALKDKGYKVNAFKCGPDYIDPMFHKEILGIPSKNLDLFFSDGSFIKKTFAEDNQSDISIIEGVMGLYDGIGGNSREASTYEVASVLNAPVVLVIDTKGMSYSVLAEIKGFIMMDDRKLIKGVILNNMSSSVFSLLKDRIEEESGIKAFGFLPPLKDIKIESRYLGLKLPEEIEGIRQMVSKAADELKKDVDLDSIISSACGIDIDEGKKDVFESCSNAKKIKIAIARDKAFCFYYEDNLSLLRKMGAELIEFSPIKDKRIPEGVSGLILGGGYPELFAGELEANNSMKQDIKRLIEGGLPVIAECGGFMYLHDTITDKEGNKFNMAGVIDGECFYTGRLVRFGYISVKEKTPHFMKALQMIKGHEFHYFDSTSNGSDCVASKPVGNRSWECIGEKDFHWWGFPHLYYPSCPDYALSFIGFCKRYGEEHE